MDRISETLKHLSETQGNLPALISESANISFARLYRQVGVLSANLAGFGLPTNARAALIFENSPQHFMLSIVLFRLGFAQISFPSDETGEINKQQCEQLEIDFIITDQELDPQFFNIKIINIMHLVEPTEALHDTSAFHPDDNNNIAMLTLGSGTTGKPKLLGHTFKQIETIALDRKALVQVKPGERFFSPTAFHFNASRSRHFTYLLQGATCVFADRSTNNLPTYLDRLNIDHLSCAVVHLDALTTAYKKKFYRNDQPRFQNLKSVLVFGSPLSAEKVIQLKKDISENLFVLYGTNETLAISLATPKDLERYPNTIGKLCPGAELTLVDKDMQPVDQRETGIAGLKAQGMMGKYINNEQADEAHFKDGWFFPNDLLRVNDEGYIFFEGRSDDLIIFDGVNIFPLEIENLLTALDEVQEAAAFPVMHPKRGTLPAVSIIVNPAYAKQCGRQFFTDLLKQHMGWKSPKVIELREEFPRNPRGKVQKFILRENLERNMANSKD